MLKEDLAARSKMEVVFDILEIADREGRFGGHYDDNNEHHRSGASGGDVIQTEIVNKALLGNNQLEEYLNVLTENDLLSFDSATRRFKITQKGRRFLEIYNNMSDLVKEVQEQQV
jgi:predicted transcriptional regulator